jgi:hypothetical protein
LDNIVEHTITSPSSILASYLSDFSSKEEEAEFNPKNPRRSKPFSGRGSFPLEGKDASFSLGGEGESPRAKKPPTNQTQSLRRTTNSLGQRSLRHRRFDSDSHPRPRNLLPKACQKILLPREREGLSNGRTTNQLRVQ